MQPCDHRPPLLGILGGLGPMASAYFYQLLVERTAAKQDSDHIDLLLSSRASTPDRTAYILGKSAQNPAPVMCEEAKRLERAGATLIAIPCNTAHFFLRQIADAVSVPVLNIVDETVRQLARAKVRKAGVLATEGTVFSDTYRAACLSAGIGYEIPSPEDQKILSHIIYEQIKRGDAPDTDAFCRVSRHLLERGCDRLVLGCTELSLIGKDGRLDPDIYADSLEILTYSTILACGKQPVGFPDWFSRPTEAPACGTTAERNPS